MDTKDDPVIHTVDVFLAKSLADQLFLVQYPVRPANKNFNAANFLTARVKPEQQRFELEVSLNTESPNYARSKGEQIALNVESNAQNKDPYYTSDLMDKQLLTSIPTGLKTHRYCAGYFKDGELHLTPIKGIVQMRPSFEYLDRADGKPEKETQEEEEEEQPKAVTVKFARRETEEAKARRMASYSYVSKKREEEAWRTVEHHTADDPISEAMRRQLLARDMRENSELQMPSQAYLDKLIPEIEEEENKKPPMPTNVLSLAELKTMPLNDQVKALLINAKVLRFSQLMYLLAKGTDQTATLRALQQCALLVQGCWVVKSEVLYPKDSCSAHSGIPAEMLCRGRDYVLWRFTQSRCVIRKDIASVIRLPAEDVKNILDQMACLQLHKGWEFILSYDNDFVHRHPDVVQRQQMIWDAKFQQLSKTLKLGKADIERKAKTDEQLLNSPERTRRRTMSGGRARSKSGGERSMSDSDSEVPSRAIRMSGQRRSRKQSGFSSGSDQERNLSRSNSAKEAKDTPANNIENHEPMDVSNGPGNENAQAALEEFVREKMLQRRVMTIKDLKTHLELKMVESQAGHILRTGVTDQMFETALNNVGCVQVPETEDTVYICVTIGDHLDPIRTVLSSFFKGIKGIKFSTLKKALEDNSTEYTDADARKVLKEYCVTKGNMYYLKGTLMAVS